MPNDRMNRVSHKPDRTVRIYKLSPEVDTDELLSCLRDDLKLAVDHGFVMSYGPNHPQAFQSKGFAIVQFSTVEDAYRAIELLHNNRGWGRILGAEMYTPKQLCEQRPKPKSSTAMENAFRAASVVS